MRRSVAAAGVVLLALVLATAGCRGAGKAAPQGAAEVTAAGPVLTVDATGKGDYTTIQDAVEAAPDGATVRVRAGVYRECLEIRKPVVIEGAGPDKTTVVSNTPWAGSMTEFRAKFDGLRAQGGEEARHALEDLVHQYGRPAALVAGTEGVAIKGLKLTLLSPGGEGLSVADGCVMLDKAKAELSNCVVAGAWTYGVEVGEGSGLRLHNSLVTAVLNCGVEVKGREGMGPVELTGTDFRGCPVGVEIAAACQTTIRDCRFLACDHAGVRYQESAPVIAHCFFAQAHQGVTGWSHGDSAIRDSVFCLSDAFAVSVGSSSKAEVEHNTFASNAFGVVVLQRPYGSAVRGNVFSDDGVGVLLPEAGAPAADGAAAGPTDGAVIEGNMFWRTAVNVGVAVRDADTHALSTRSLALPEANTLANPMFQDAANLNYAPGIESPALRRRAGALAPLPSGSKWPEQAEETRMPRDEDQPMGGKP